MKYVFLHKFPTNVDLDLIVWHRTRERFYVHPVYDTIRYDTIDYINVQNNDKDKVLAATLRGSRPGVQSASLIMTSLMTS